MVLKNYIKNRNLDFQTLIDWDYSFYQELLGKFGLITASFQLVFFYILKYIVGFEESAILRFGSVFLLIGFWFLPKKNPLLVRHKLYIELTYFWGLPITFYSLMIMNNINTYWFSSMAFCGFVHGLLSFQPISFSIYTIISITLTLVNFISPTLLASINSGNNLIMAHIVCVITFLLSSIIRMMLQGGYKKLLNLNTEITKKELLEKNYFELKKREDVIKKFISPLILSEIESGGNPLIFLPQKINYNILFTDMRNYTHFSEKHILDENYEILNRYFVKINESIVRYEGRIDKLIGDAVMAIFENSENCLNACIDVRKKMSQENFERISRGQDPIKFGMGISYGEVLYANFGSDEKLDRTVVGDVVNISSRLESLTKEYKVDVLASRKFVSKIPQYECIRIIDTIKIRGKDQYESIYEIFGHNRKEVIEWKLKTKKPLEEINQLTISRDINTAFLKIDQLIKKCPQHLYLKDAIMDPTLLEIKKKISSLIKEDYKKAA